MPISLSSSYLQYLWSFIKDADVFVAHPVKAFVPQNVLDSKMPIVYMAPSTEYVDFVFPSR
jgi:hypothetical protein